jgi:phosphohistidine phosphatase
VKIFLLHHADAVGPDVDPQRPLSSRGVAHATALAIKAKGKGCASAAIWHSGKLRARQTAEPFLRECQPFAEFKIMRGLLPDDPPAMIIDTLNHETRDVMLAGHMPHMADLLRALSPSSAPFPLHGLVALERDEQGVKELWRGS